MKYLWLRKLDVQRFEFMITTNNWNQGPSWWNKFDICWKSFLAKTSLIRDIQKLSICYILNN